jgi:hypothetical protein
MPNRTLVISGPKLLINAPTLGLIGSGCQRYNLRQNDTQGFATDPQPLPEDFDVSYPCSLYFRYAVSSTDTSFGTGIEIGLVLTRLPRNANWQDFVLQRTFNVPTVLDLLDVYRQQFDDGAGYTLPPHSFVPGDAVAVSFTRIGANTNDTYEGGLRVATSFELEYHRRCQFCC